MKLLMIYAVLAYIGGMFIMHKRINHVKILNLKDLILFLLSPLSMTPLLLIPILSTVINLDQTIFKLK